MWYAKVVLIELVFLPDVCRFRLFLEVSDRRNESASLLEMREFLMGFMLHTVTADNQKRIFLTMIMLVPFHVLPGLLYILKSIH